MTKSKDKVGSFNFGFNAKGAKKSKGAAKGGKGKGGGKGKSNAWRAYTGGK